MTAARRHVCLIAGPPCAGKSTLVAQHLEPGDLVADFDAVARELGSPGKWMHPPAVGDAAERRMDDLVLEAASLQAGRAWVIRCAPEPELRVALARRLAANRVIVLRPPLSVLLVRARARPLAAETQRAIHRWLDRYEPAAGDELVRDPSTLADLGEV